VSASSGAFLLSLAGQLGACGSPRRLGRGPEVARRSRCILGTVVRWSIGALTRGVGTRAAFPGGSHVRLWLMVPSRASESGSGDRGRGVGDEGQKRMIGFRA
jgi:hypothetical protein